MCSSAFVGCCWFVFTGRKIVLFLESIVFGHIYFCASLEWLKLSQPKWAGGMYQTLPKLAHLAAILENGVFSMSNYFPSCKMLRYLPGLFLFSRENVLKTKILDHHHVVLKRSLMLTLAGTLLILDKI